MFCNSADSYKYGHVRASVSLPPLVCLILLSACVGPLPDDAEQQPAMGTGGSSQDAGTVGGGGQVGTGGRVATGGHAGSGFVGNGGHVGSGGVFGNGGRLGGSGGMPSDGMGGLPPTALAISPFEVSRRLSLFLLGTNAAMVNPADVSSVGEIRRTTQSLVASGQANGQLAKFYRWWLNLQAIEGIKIEDSALSPVVRQAMANEPMEFAIRTTAARGKYNDLILTGTLHVPDVLSVLYGTPPGVQRPAMRAGLLTMPGILAMGTMVTRTSPTARGQFIATRFFCQPFPPPPANINSTVPPQAEWGGRTLREELGTLMTSPQCLACHRDMDQTGFPYENFDLVGRLRTSDNGRPIDASGAWRETSVNGPQEMAMLLASDPDARRCFVDRWLQFASVETLGRFTADQEVWDASVTAANDWARPSDHNLVEVIVGVASSPLFLAP